MPKAERNPTFLSDCRTARNFGSSPVLNLVQVDLCRFRLTQQHQIIAAPFSLFLQIVPKGKHQKGGQAHFATTSGRFHTKHPLGDHRPVQCRFAEFEVFLCIKRSRAFHPRVMVGVMISRCPCARM